MRVLEEIAVTSPQEISLQMQDNIRWIREAKQNNLVVGSQARILYADCEGRTRIAEAFNNAIANGDISAPIVLGRDHHDVSGTDSPYRETSNIYDGSQFTADMAVQNVIGDSFRGATWVSLHNGGGVGWGEVINGGFGMLLDGSADAGRRLKLMLHWDVNNGISRRSWARNQEAIFAIKRAMAAEPDLKVTLPNLVDDQLLESLF
jgi:urocanate hydratase